MKKNFITKSILFVCSILLIACVNNNESSNEQNDTVNNQINDENVSVENNDSTSNPLDVIKDDSFEFFQNGSAELEIIGRYTSEESDENGIIELEANGYKITFALILMHSPIVNENTLYVLGKHENMNKDDARMGIPPSVVKVDDEAKLKDTFSVGSLEADVETTIISTILLDGDVEPDTIEIMFQEPTELEDDKGEVEMDDNDDEVWKVIKFNKK